ncbi:MAG TPA: family 1 glycosylhydrolase [Microthrixaceae bacterium]|nr:family 1 glycosylhydrolase [Microthrixaceae bacterium]
MSDERFPEGFMWGTGASSTQTEGVAPAADLAPWVASGRLPDPGDGNGFATRYAEDFALLAEHGLTHHRLSLEWARLEPREGRHDRAEVERYREMLLSARDAGLSTWVCLHHFTLPGWFSDDLGGFGDERGLTYYWPRHVEWVAETFGDLIDGWKPINEPVAYAALGHLSGTLPPGRTDLSGFAETLRDVQLANLDAWRRLRGGGAPVATVMSLTPLVSRATGSEPEARDKAREWTTLIDQVVWGSWIRMLRDGVLDVPMVPPVEVPDAAGAFDLIGFSYYFASAVDEHGSFQPHPLDLEVGPQGYVRWPGGITTVLERLADELPGRPLLVSEAGVGTGVTEPGAEELRSRYMTEIVDRVADAIAAGIDVRGLFWWTGVDNYEWHSGHDVQFGLFDRERRPRDGAELARRWAT